MKLLNFKRVWYIKCLETFGLGKALLIHTQPVVIPIFSGVASTKFFLQFSIDKSKKTKKRPAWDTIKGFVGVL